MSNIFSEIGKFFKDNNASKAMYSKKTAKALAADVGKHPITVSKLGTNAAQPSLETLYKIANVLDVDIRTLLLPTKEGMCNM